MTFLRLLIYQIYTNYIINTNLYFLYLNLWSIFTFSQTLYRYIKRKGIPRKICFGLVIVLFRSEAFRNRNLTISSFGIFELGCCGQCCHPPPTVASLCCRSLYTTIYKIHLQYEFWYIRPWLWLVICFFLNLYIANRGIRECES